MDISKLFKTVNNLDSYIEVTAQLKNKQGFANVILNIRTVKLLKGFCKWEIEYFTKQNENGAAIILFECILGKPSCKTWGLLGEDLVLILRYWMETALQFIGPFKNWWAFLRKILELTQTLCDKDQLIHNMLVEKMSMGMFDLAINEQLDISQKNFVLKCLNKCGAGSSKEIQLQTVGRLNAYFNKLSHYMSCCGHMDVQLNILQALLQWLPQHDKASKQAAAFKWFPKDLYSSNAVTIFLQRKFQEFQKDARDFLNAHNDSNGLVVSVLCKKLTVGKVVVISPQRDNTFWLDLNIGTQCLTAALTPAVLRNLDVEDVDLSDLLTVTEGNTESVCAYSDPEVMIEIKTIMMPDFIYKSTYNILDEFSKCTKVQLSSRTDMEKLDKGLRAIFHKKYQRLSDVRRTPTPEPAATARTRRKFSSSDEDPRLVAFRFKPPRKKRFGYVTNSLHYGALNSPSTTSTTSLLQLRSKVEAHARQFCDRDLYKLHASQNLSTLSELTEPGESCAKVQSSRIAKSPLPVSFVVDKTSTRHTRDILPDSDDDNVENSCLYSASNHSLNNNTIEFDNLIGNDLDKTIVDQIVNEALNCDQSRARVAANTGLTNGAELPSTNNKEVQDQFAQKNITTNEVENTLNDIENSTNKVVHSEKKYIGKGKRKDSGNSTTGDESKSEFIENTPIDYVNMRRKKYVKNQRKLSEQNNLKPKDSEMISHSNEIFPNKNIYTVNENDIIECLNYILDTIHKNINANIVLDKFGTESLITKTIKTPTKKEKDKNDMVTVSKPVEVSTVRNIKNNTKKSNNIKRKNSKTTIKKKDLKRSQLHEEDDFEWHSDLEDIPLQQIRRRRKLYSPHEEVIEKNLIDDNSERKDDRSKNKVEPKRKSSSSAACYEEIITARANYNKNIIKKRLRSDKGTALQPTSPRSKKNDDLFEKLKDDINMDVLVFTDQVSSKTRSKKDIRVYNFSSDSEDSDIAIEKLQKKKSTTTTMFSSDTKSTKSINTRNVPKVIKSLESRSSSSVKTEPRKKAVTKKKGAPKKKNCSVQKKIKETDNVILEDERMREAPLEENILNNSMICINIDNDEENLLRVPSPKSHIYPVVEIITAPENNNVTEKTLCQNNDQMQKCSINESQQEHRKGDLNSTCSSLPSLQIEPVDTECNINEFSLQNRVLEIAEQFIQETTNCAEKDKNITNDTFSDFNDINVNFSPQVYIDARNTSRDTPESHISETLANGVILETDNNYMNERNNVINEKNYTTDKKKYIVEKRKLRHDKNCYTNRKSNFTNEKSNVLNEKSNLGNKESKLMNTKRKLTNKKSNVTNKFDFVGANNESNNDEHIITHRIINIPNEMCGLTDSNSDATSEAFETDNTAKVNKKQNEMTPIRSENRRPVVSLKRLSPEDICNLKCNRSVPEGVSRKRRKLRLSDCCTEIEKSRKIDATEKDANNTSDLMFNTNNLTMFIPSLHLLESPQKVLIRNQHGKVYSNTKDRFSCLLNNSDIESCSSSSDMDPIILTKTLRSTSTPRKISSNDVRRAKVSSKSMFQMSAPMKNTNDSMLIDWLDTSATPSSRDHFKSEMTEDYINMVMEKMDTAFADLHQETNASFQKMYADIEKEFAEAHRWRIAQYKLIEDKAQDMCQQMVSKVKSEQTQLIRNNMQRTRATVIMLRKDIGDMMSGVLKKHD